MPERIMPGLGLRAFYDPGQRDCAASGASSFDGYMGVISDGQREEFDSGNNPITLGSIGYRGNGSLWSSDTSTASQRITDLPPYGAGDVLMFVLDPAAASLWIGKNGIWRDDPVSGAPSDGVVHTARHWQILAIVGLV